MALTAIFDKLLGRRRPVTYEQARELARDPDPAVRRDLAGRDDLQPEILYFLAVDPDPEVRRRIAFNHTTPVQAHLLLAKDSDDGVRGELAQKIARLVPGLSLDEQDRLHRLTREVLETLARDQVTRVRQILAEELKDKAHAPADVIGRLARDSELAVAAPVLQFSPVLSDEDLLEIIAAHPICGALAAISSRAGVGGPVSDAIANSNDIAAIAVLLGNKSAQIREETLDRLIDRAPDIDSWHAPLVQRPHLTSKAGARLARFLADSLLERLQARNDLDPATAEAVAAAVHRRLDAALPALRAPRPPPPAAASPGVAWDAALKLHRAGQLDEEAVARALGVNDHDFVLAALAVRGELRPGLPRKVAEMHSAKGMTALAWRAGLSAAMAERLQEQLGQVPLRDVLRAKNSRFALSAAEMEWQIEFFASLSGAV